MEYEHELKRPNMPSWPATEDSNEFINIMLENVDLGRLQLKEKNMNHSLLEQETSLSQILADDAFDETR